MQRKYLEKEKIFLEEKKNGEGKGGKCLDTEKNFWEEKKKRESKIRKVFG